MADDPYATLGVSKNASEEDIRRAFRKLAKELHPDIAKGTEEKFKKVSSAYEILGDPDKRRAYDRGEIDGRGDPRHPASASTRAGRARVPAPALAAAGSRSSASATSSPTSSAPPVSVPARGRASSPRGQTSVTRSRSISSRPSPAPPSA